MQGMASRAQPSFFAQSSSQTKPRQAELRLGHNTTIYHCFDFKTSNQAVEPSPFVNRFLVKRQIMLKFISLPPVLDGSKSGKMAWKIDLSNSKYNVKSVELLVQSKIYENGKIIWQLLGDSKALLPTPGKFMIMINLIHSLL